MTAADVTSRAELPLAEENLSLTVSTGETYTTRLGNIRDVQATWGQAAAGTATISLVVSGRTITFTHTGEADSLIYVTVKGDL